MAKLNVSLAKQCLEDALTVYRHALVALNNRELIEMQDPHRNSTRMEFAIQREELELRIFKVEVALGIKNP